MFSFSCEVFEEKIVYEQIKNLYERKKISYNDICAFQEGLYN